MYHYLSLKCSYRIVCGIIWLTRVGLAPKFENNGNMRLTIFAGDLATLVKAESFNKTS